MTKKEKEREKRRIIKDLHVALDQLPEIMMGLQQMLKIVKEQELNYEKMDDYTPLNRAIDLIDVAHGNTTQSAIDHLIKAYSPDSNYISVGVSVNIPTNLRHLMRESEI